MRELKEKKQTDPKKQAEPGEAGKSTCWEGAHLQQQLPAIYCVCICGVFVYVVFAALIVVKPLKAGVVSTVFAFPSQDAGKNDDTASRCCSAARTSDLCLGAGLSNDM